MLNVNNETKMYEIDNHDNNKCKNVEIKNKIKIYKNDIDVRSSIMILNINEMKCNNIDGIV